jgi:hypothetical protein
MLVFIVGGQRGNKHRSKMLPLRMMISHFKKQGRSGGMLSFVTSTGWARRRITVQDSKQQ